MLKRRFTLRLMAASLPAVALTTVAARAEEPPVFQTNGVAIGGTDPVAYFSLDEDAGPVVGQPEFVAEWNGATWYFASAENRDQFLEAPEAFAPAYGGYCAFAAARGYVASTVPEAWTVRDGRLFLNYSLRIRRRWLRDLPDAIEQADANWPGILTA